jgi:hypothetical protein
MKEITRAYEDGDIARLVELERRHLGAEAPAAAPIPDDVDARCAALERMNAALAAQLKTVRRELRSLRAGPDGETLKDLKSSGRPLAEAVAAMIEEAEAELAALTRVRDLVRGFRDGRVSIEELEAGVPGAGWGGR